MNSHIESSPKIINGILYLGSFDGFFYALNARNGRPLLQFNTYSSVLSSPEVSNGMVFVGAEGGKLYAIDGHARNWFLENKLIKYWRVLYMYGDLPKPPPPSGYLWSLNLGGIIKSSPLIVDKKLYIGAGSRLIALDIPTKEVLWRFRTRGWIESSPAISGDVIYIGSDDGCLYALNALDGSLRWRLQTNDKISASPTVADGIVYIGSHDGNLYAVE